MSEDMTMRPIIVFLSTYTFFFLLHIVFAAKDLNLLFQIVAVVLVAMTFFCGPVLWMIGNNMKRTDFESSKIGYLLSLPLTIGIAYAYTDMEFQFVETVLALSLTTLTHWSWFQLMKAK